MLVCITVSYPVALFWNVVGTGMGLRFDGVCLW